MNPIFLGLAAGGIALIVVLHYVLGQTRSLELPQEAEIRHRFEDAIGESPEDIAICKEMAVALDRKGEQIWVLFVHGLHLNMRSYPRASVQSLRVKEGTPPKLELRVDSFDRGHFCDDLRDDQQAASVRLCAAVEKWNAEKRG